MRTIVFADWGTSSLRLWLCEVSDQACEVLDSRKGPGTKTCGDCEMAFFDQAKDWLDRADDILICGTAGSNIGWRETSYAAAPAALEDLAGHILTFEARGRTVHIAPGVNITKSAAGQPDTMRGEELQIFGWSAQSGGAEDAVLILPGTHSKWAKVEGGRITQLASALTGELFAALRDHTVIIPAQYRAAPFDDAAFAEGVQAARDCNLHNLIPAVRSRQLAGELAPEGSLSFLSGVLIGGEIMSLKDSWGAPLSRLTVIGDGALSQRYAAAAGQLGITADIYDGEQAVLSGLAALYRHMI